MIQMARGTEPALCRVQALLPADFPAPLWEAVQAGMTRHAAQFPREVESLGPA